MKLVDLTSKFKVSLDDWCNYYVLSYEKMQQFRSELNNPTTIDKINSLFQNKNENIVSLIQYPTEKINLGTDEEAIKIANITCTTQGIRINKPFLSNIYSLGKFSADSELFTIPEDLNNIEVNLWCPYVGFLKLDVEKIYGKICELLYLINFNDGTCTAYLVHKLTTYDYEILYQKDGQVGRSISFGGRNTEKELKALSGVLASSFSLFGNVLKGDSLAGTVSLGGLAYSGINLLSDKFNNNVVSQKYNDVNAPQYAYLSIIRRKINTALYNSETFKNTIGYKTNILKTLNTLTGFTQCSNFNLNNFNTATKQELELITKYLTSGIIL